MLAEPRIHLLNIVPKEIGPGPGPGSMTVWRHRNGGLYTVLFVSEDTVFYACHVGGMGWFRPLQEFCDGRFAPEPFLSPLGVDDLIGVDGQLGHFRRG